MSAKKFSIAPVRANKFYAPCVNVFLPSIFYSSTGDCLNQAQVSA